MIILTNCLTEKADEGCLKVANSLTKRIKQKNPSTTILSYGNVPAVCDMHLRLNKLFLNRKLLSFLRKKNEPVLYIPFSSNTKASILRTWILSRYCKQVSVLFVLRHPMSRVFGKLLRWSGAKILALSEESRTFFEQQTGREAVYLKTGVDVERFRPVTAEEKANLRKENGIPADEKVLLHVGHLKEGRNIRSLLDVDETFHVLLVVSSQTENEWDEALRAQLAARPNITILDSFIEKIEQIYQLSDVYLFPVQDAGNCIDTPLSVLEAAACGIPVVTTAYGALKEIIYSEGFYPIRSLEREDLNALLDQALQEQKSPRACVMDHDWNLAVERLLEMEHSGKKGV